MYRIISCIILYAVLQISTSCKVHQALSFDKEDDVVHLGNIYDNAQFPVTIAAWIFVDPSTTYQNPIFASQTDGPRLYKGFWFVINPTHLFAEPSCLPH
jgi:hypothetical protein